METNLVNIKDYVGQQFIGKNFHFKCECLFPLDFIGKVLGYRISSDEIVLSVSKESKIISIGLNHPKLQVEQIS
jgi:hypothetical protein